jgi:hypothetical protein
MLLKATGNNLFIMVGHYNIPKGIKTIFLKPIEIKKHFAKFMVKTIPLNHSHL